MCGLHREQRWGLNTYLYAPKDDSKHRMYWRDLYSTEEAGESQQGPDTPEPVGRVRTRSGHRQPSGELLEDAAPALPAGSEQKIVVLLSRLVARLS